MTLQLVLQIILPILFLTILWSSHFQSRLEWLLNVLVLGSVLLFSFLVARWDWFSYYLRILQFPLFAVASYIAYRRIKPDLLASSNRLRYQTGLAFNGALILIATWFNVAALRGFFYTGDPVVLTSPLKNGIFYVGGGGSSTWLNAHRADNSTLANDFALDIVRLNAWGNRADGLEPNDLTDYAIFGDPVHSPCTGTIKVAMDELPDQIPPQRDNANPAGNHVVISCQGIKVIIAHLMNGSLEVETGDPVTVGQIIGQVGNSGSTSQPHLHIHAATGGSPTGVLDGDGIPILLNGKFLTRNSLFNGK